MERIKYLGIGTDIEDIRRFEKLDRVKNSRFLNKIFTENELNYCFLKEKAASSLAARYAGKEAVVKAIASIGKRIIDYKEIEILNNNIGVPLVRIRNKKIKNLKVNISLSHCKDKAVAFAVVI